MGFGRDAAHRVSTNDDVFWDVYPRIYLLRVTGLSKCRLKRAGCFEKGIIGIQDEKHTDLNSVINDEIVFGLC